MSVKHSASRALALIKAMNARPVSSVRELAQATGVSKPSVVRLLAILIEDGFVQRASRAGSYTLTRNVLLLSSGFREDSTLARVAAPWMEKLTKEIGWPCALGLFETGSMVVRHSTIPSSPLAWYRTTLYMRLGLQASAMGQIFLAHCDPRTRLRLVEVDQNANVSASETSDEFFGRVKQRGYGLRPASADHPTFSFSVPVIATGNFAGALSVTIYARAMSLDKALERYLDRLVVTADQIAQAASDIEEVN